VKARTRKNIESVLVYIGVAIFILTTLAPVLWLMISSVSSTNDLTALPLQWLPKTFDFSRYAALLSLEANGPFAGFVFALRNSLITVIGSVLISMAVAIPAGYSFSRFPGSRSNLLYVVLATYMIPPVALILPLYTILASLKLLNTTAGLMLVYCTILTPFMTWLLKTNFDGVPLEVEEAAQLDGLSRWNVLLRVTLPLALPGLSTAAVWAVLIGWDEFFYALIFTNNITAKTIPVAIADFAAGRAVDYGLICAAGVLAALPPVIIGFLLQKGLLSGLTAGSVKG
jgi:multiple sugar transport system permease protein